MPQYAILIYETELPGGVADIPPEVMEANMAVEGRIAAMGARVVYEPALEPASTARTIHRDGLVTDGPVPGDQGGHRRVLRGRGGRPGAGGRDRPAAADHGRGGRGAAAADCEV